MRHFRTPWYGGRVAVGLLLVATSSAWGGISVSPLKQEASLRPGDAGKVAITLTNNSRSENDPPRGMRLSLTDVQVSEAGSMSFKEPGLLDNSASRWASLSQTEVTLRPGESKVVECSLTPPPSAAPGEYYTAIMVTLADKGRNEKGVVVEYRIASGVFLTVLGRTYPKQAKISRCELLWPQAPATTTQAAPTTTVDAPPVSVELPKVSVALENTGRARFDGAGKLTITDDRARTVLVAPLLSNRPCVFAGDRRLFEAPVTKALPPGHYRLKVEMDYQSTWAMARYEMPVEILPESAEILARLQGRESGAASLVEAMPEKIAPVLPAGATRSLAVSVRNLTEAPLQCAAVLAAADNPSAADGWITVGPQAFTLAKGSRKSVEVTVRVPASAAAGQYLANIVVEAGPEGSALRKLIVPVELEVRNEK